LTTFSVRIFCEVRGWANKFASEFALQTPQIFLRSVCMKKRMVFFVLLVLMFGFVLAGCDNGTSGGGDYTIIIKNTSGSQTIGRVRINDYYAGEDVIDETPNIGPGEQKTYNPSFQADGSDVLYEVFIYDSGDLQTDSDTSQGNYYPDEFPITYTWNGASITLTTATGKDH
jgi:predicted small secreted protein